MQQNSWTQIFFQESDASNDSGFEHNYSINESSNPIIDGLLKEVSTLKEDKLRNQLLIKELKSQISTLNRKLFICKLNYERRFQVDNVPKKLQNQIVAKKLSGRFTEAQIDIMCSDKKRTRSNKYSKEDYLFALKVKQLSPRAVKAIKKVLPMPDNKTTSTKFSWIHSIPGYLQPVIKLFKLLDGKLEENENLCMINFDEMFEK